jgi:hypothetical protein
MRRWIGARVRGVTASVLVLTVVLAIGVLGQTSPNMVPDYRFEIEEYDVRSSFVHSIESQVPANASIFQLSDESFPFSFAGMYSSFFSNSLRWSFGAMLGRPANWAPALVKKPVRQMLEGISAIGFSGIAVEFNASPTILRSLSTELRVEPSSVAEGQLAFFNMAPYNQRFRERHTAAQVASIAHAALRS